MPWFESFTLIFRYLGAPIGIAITPLQKFEWCLKKLEGKFVRWRGKAPSFLAGLTIAKHVLEPCLVYVMLLLPFSKNCTNKVNKLLRDFVWDSQWHSFNWQIITTPKSCGGFGLTPMKNKADALCSKLLTRLPSSQPWAMIIRQWISANGVVDISRQSGKWQDVLLGQAKVLIKESSYASSLVQCWQGRLKGVKWKGGSTLRGDPSRSVNIWLSH